MTIAGYTLASVGLLVAGWGLAGLLDRHSRSEDDGPAFAAGLVMLGWGILLVWLGYV